MADINSIDEARTAESLIRDLEGSRGLPCAGCKKSLTAHEVLMAIAIGFKNGLRCVPCLAAFLECDPTELRESLMALIQRRECYTEAWNWASREAGDTDELIPPRMPDGLGTDSDANAPSPNAVPNIPEAAGLWDAGHRGCGELVLELRSRLQILEPGQVFELIARDAGAPEDLPAWCRLVGHTLLRAAHPHYWIQRRH